MAEESVFDRVRRFCCERGWPGPSSLSQAQVDEIRRVFGLSRPSTKLPGWRLPLPPEHRGRELGDGPLPGPLDDESEAEELDFERSLTLEDWESRQRDPNECFDWSPVEANCADNRAQWLGERIEGKARHGQFVRTLKASDEARIQYNNWRDWQGGTLTPRQWFLLRQAYGGCAYCGATGKLVIEHMTPLSRGGRTNVLNIVPSCWACNSEKGTSTVEEWLHGDRLEAFKGRQERALKNERLLAELDLAERNRDENES